MRRFVVGVFIAALFAGMYAPSAHALSLQIRPTIYKNIVLSKGEKSKGYVDISNPTARVQDVELSVKRYQQTDNSGSLSYVDDEAIAKGVLLDLYSFQLNPRDSIRVYFMLDSSKLPTGDVFAAIFARTVPTKDIAAQSVQVGTLLSIVNGAPTSRTATVSVMANPLQIGDGIKASIAVRNTALKGTATGFFPTLAVSIKPYTSRTVDGPLVFAGMTRDVSYRQSGNFFGPALISVQTGSESDSQWVFMITGYWRWLAPVIIVIVVAIWLALWRKLRHKIGRRIPERRRPAKYTRR